MLQLLTHSWLFTKEIYNKKNITVAGKIEQDCFPLLPVSLLTFSLYTNLYAMPFCFLLYLKAPA